MKTMTVVTIASAHPADAYVAASSWRAFANAGTQAPISLSAYPVAAAAAATFKRTARTVASPASSPPV